MSGFEYPWGQMRPTAFRRTLKRQMDENASLRVAATAAYHQLLKQLDNRDQRYRDQLDFVDKVTAQGKYNSQIAQSLLQSSPHIFQRVSDADASDRSDLSRLRKSRAKVNMTMNTVMDIMRGVGPTARSTEEDRTIAANAAPSPCLARAETHDQLADGNDISQNFSAFGSSDSGEEALDAERQERADKIERQNAFLVFENGAESEVSQILHAHHMYDFSDACDSTSLPQELASLYPVVDTACCLPLVASSDEIPQEVYGTWARALDRKYILQVSKQIRIEYDRRQVWPWIHLRLNLVSRLDTVHGSSCYSDDDLDSLAKFDYMVEGQVSPEQRRQYAQIVDLLQWPKETSRRELILRADPAYDLDLLYDYESLLDYSSDAGPAKNSPAWRRMREPRPSSVDDALMRLYERSREAQLV